MDAFCFSFLSSRESGIYRGRGQAAQNSRFSGIVSSRALWALLHSPCENRESVDRGAWRCGIGDSQRGLLRGRGTSFPSFKSLSCYSLNSEFVFDKPQSVIRTGILHIALVVGGDVLHQLSAAVIAGELYGCTRSSSSLMSTLGREEVPYAVVQSHSCLHFLFLLLSLFRFWGSRSCPPIPASTQNS